MVGISPDRPEGIGHCKGGIILIRDPAQPMALRDDTPAQKGSALLIELPGQHPGIREIDHE